MLEYKPETIGLLTTNECQGECSICGISSRRIGGEKLSVGEMKSCIGQAYDLGIRYLGLTGGDPFDLDEMLEVIGFAHSKRMYSGLMTNANYAKSMKDSLEYAKSLKKAGLGMMRISVDMDHNKRVPYENWLNAIRGALRAGLHIRIASVVRMSTAMESRDLIEKVAKDLNGVIDDYKGKFPGQKRIIVKDMEIPIISAFIYHVGRARNLEREEFFWYSLSPEESCRANDTILVNSNGQILPCDSLFSIENEEQYSVGNINNTTLKEALKTINESSILTFLKEPEGSRKLIEMMKTSAEPTIREIANREYTGFCEFCSEVLKNQSAKKMVFEKHSS
jgi:MoaA/NifB/PqqE/SkfB family radical SAM enzyme